MSRSFWCEFAWLGQRSRPERPGFADQEVTPGVLIEVADGTILHVEEGIQRAPEGATLLAGLTLPGLANAHSHAFHRALRARTQGAVGDNPNGGLGSFWTWREQMYTQAASLTPGSYYRLARATLAEMALAGVAVVGEFHYVHHQIDGTPYDDPNAMGHAVLRAAADVGLRLTLLDTAYLRGGIAASEVGVHLPLASEQRRFADTDINAWSRRVDALLEEAHPDPVKVGAAIHSVRALNPDEIQVVGQFARNHSLPLHVHLSETLTENEQCQQGFGLSPTELLSKAGVLGPHLTAVHATHLSDIDIELLGRTGTGVCLCPTTERDLADGIGPSPDLSNAGSPLSLGSDSHAVIDLFSEARAVELNQRLLNHQRGTHSPPALASMATANGYRALGWDNGGTIETGQLADFVSVRLDSVRTAGSRTDSFLATVIFAATASDVHSLVVNGNQIVRDGQHHTIDVANELSEAIA